MADDGMAEAAGAATILQYDRGDILVWWTASEGEAYQMGEAATELGLGSWSVTPIGLGAAAYFDLVLDRAADVIEILLVFGRGPRGVY